MISTKIGKKLYMLQKKWKTCIENKGDNKGQRRSQVNTLTLILYCLGMSISYRYVREKKSLCFMIMVQFLSFVLDIFRMHLI